MHLNFHQKFMTFSKNDWYLKKHLVEIEMKILLHQKDFKPLWHDELENSPNSKSIFNVGSIQKCTIEKKFIRFDPQERGTKPDLA